MDRGPNRGRRPEPARPAAVDARRIRSLEEPLDVRLKAREPYALLEVKNPIHRTVYLVMLPEHPSADIRLCTCTDFARRGLGTCKHIEAGLRWLASHADAVPEVVPRPEKRTDDLWIRIERAIDSSEAPERRSARSIARAGRFLYE